MTIRILLHRHSKIIITRFHFAPLMNCQHQREVRLTRASYKWTSRMNASVHSSIDMNNVKNLLPS